MLYLLYGTDTDKTREKARALVATLRKKEPEAELFRVNSEYCSDALLQELAAGQGLFSSAYIIQLSFLFEKPEMKEVFLNRLEEIAQSPNIFISLEGDVDKKTLLMMAEVAEKVQSFEKKKTVGKAEFNIFSLTDAFGKRDKRNLWVLFQKAIGREASPEEIHGILFWQLKSMLLASSCASAGEAGISPFVFRKSKGFLKNYSAEELQNLSSKFVSLYHDAHRGIHDFSIALERLILTL